MKYVVLIHPDTGAIEIRQGAGPTCSHRGLAMEPQLRGLKVRSAGFYYFNETGGCVVHGRSETLNIGIHGDDPKDLAFWNRAERTMHRSAA